MSARGRPLLPLVLATVATQSSIVVLAPIVVEIGRDLDASLSEVGLAGVPAYFGADARAALIEWAERHGIVYSHESKRGRALPCGVDHLRVSPGTEPDYSKWETELAFLIVDG